MTSNNRRTESLGRLLSRENQMNDLLAYLIDLDNSPLVTALALPAGEYSARREVMTTGSKKSRMDLVIYPDSSDTPAAIMELKAAADTHGNQLERYEVWAEHFTPQPLMYYAALDGDLAAAPNSWIYVHVPALFAEWKKSKHEGARWLATEISTLLSRWNAEADSVTGDSTVFYNADLVCRRSAYDLQRSLYTGFGDASHAYAIRTNGGFPMLVATTNDPRSPQHGRIGVDVRSQERQYSGKRWIFRPFVEIEPEGLTTDQVRRLAHELSAGLAQSLLSNALIPELQKFQPEISSFLKPSKHQGLHREPTGEELLRQKQLAEAGQIFPSDPKIFYQDSFRDGGIRLASQFGLDVSSVNRGLLAQIISTTVRYLYRAASEQTVQPPSAATPSNSS